jgi:hypothetical protein
MKHTILEYLRGSYAAPILLSILLRVLSLPLRALFALTFGRLDPVELWRHALPLANEPFQRIGVFKRFGRVWEYRIFENPSDGAPFLLRIFFSRNVNRSGDPGRYLHFFYRSDSDRELHNHPWAWGVSLVLRGGYREHTDWGVEDFEPGRVNLLLAHTFHRVELRRDPWREIGAWTFFWSGPRVGVWGFVDDEGSFTPAADYHKRTAQIAGRLPVPLLGPGNPDRYHAHTGTRADSGALVSTGHA